MNDFKHLKRLSGVKSGSGIKFLTPAVSPGNHCPMRIASVIVEDIEGLSSLLLGTPECATHSRLFSPAPEGKHGELHWLYVLDSNEVVFGCREGLMDALREMDRAGAKAVLIISTCIPDLIGEDIEGMIHEIQPELSAKITHVMLGQFKNVSYPPGSWKSMEAMAELMAERETVTTQVNILGRSPSEEHIPAPSILGELVKKGLRLRYLAPGAKLTDFLEAADAALNINLSPFTQPLAARMEDEFGIPFIPLHTLYQPDEIEQAYSSVADRFGFEWNGEFDEEKNEAQRMQKEAEQKLKDLKYIFSQRIDMPVPLAAYLTEIGMEPLMLHLEEYYPEDKDHSKKILNRGFDPLICRMVQPMSDADVMAMLKPDICLGYLMKETMLNVPDMYDFYGQSGYGRTCAILSRILETAEKLTKSYEEGE